MHGSVPLCINHRPTVKELWTNMIDAHPTQATKRLVHGLEHPERAVSSTMMGCQRKNFK
jgi:hypothetical protein